MQVVDLMTGDVITVSRDAGIRDAALLMLRNRVSGLPVVDEEGRLCGVVTEADFLRLEARRGEGAGKRGETVGEVMQPRVVTITPETEISRAARLMTEHGVNRLPVVDEYGDLIGIIARADIVSVFARPDDVIEDEIREDLIRRVLRLDPERLDVSVAGGVVTFTGSVGTRDEARLLEEFATRLDGVLRVESELAWESGGTPPGS